MKKLLAVSVGILVSVCLVTGCTTNNNPDSSTAEDVKQTGERMMDGTKRAVNNAADMGNAVIDDMTQPNNK